MSLKHARSRGRPNCQREICRLFDTRRPAQPEIHLLPGDSGKHTFVGLAPTTAKFLDVFGATIHDNLPPLPLLDNSSGFIRRSGQLGRDSNVFLGYLRVSDTRSKKGIQIAKTAVAEGCRHGLQKERRSSGEECTSSNCVSLRSITPLAFLKSRARSWLMRWIWVR